MKFKFAHLIPDRYRHTIKYDLTDPEGSSILTLDVIAKSKYHYGIDLRLRRADLDLPDGDFAKSFLAPMFGAFERALEREKTVQ